MIVVTVVIIPLLIYTKIIIRIYVNSDENLIEIEYIDRFKIDPKTVKAKLSDTAMQVEEIEDKSNLRFNNGKPYLILYLTNDAFKTIAINDQTFNTINEVISFFEELKMVAVRTIRKKRLSLGRNRRRHSV